MSRADLAGLVLAGGTSSRFGRDKLVEPVRGAPLVSRAVAALTTACDGPVLAASGDGVGRPELGLPQVADLVPGLGPLAAIAAGLLAVRDDAAALAVVAGDTLDPDGALLAWLAARRGRHACALVEVAGWLQPLHAVWSCEVADEVAAAARAGQPSPLRWLADRDDVLVLSSGEVVAAGLDPGAASRDVDVPTDLPDDVTPDS